MRSGGPLIECGLSHTANEEFGGHPRTSIHRKPGIEALATAIEGSNAGAIFHSKRRLRWVSSVGEGECSEG